jgi:ABC exporter DevB family membrane fusion protein
MKKKQVLTALAMILALILSMAVVFARSRNARGARVNSQTQQGTAETLVAGPGRVEPSSEDIKLGSELSGKLKSVNVEEGDSITRGQVVAVLENDDYRAQVASAEAEVSAKEAGLRKVLNGARSQERSEAWSSVRAAQAVMDNARSEMDRRQKLFAAGVISREESERSTREYDVAKAKYQEAVERHSLVDSTAREEDLSLAEANLRLARARLDEARARYAKTFVKSPIEGTVLRKHHRNGESVSNSSNVADAILTIGDKKVLRVRMEVDETEVSKVRVGQKAYVVADAFGRQKFWGRVVRVGEQLGRKNVRTDEPAERVDTKVLETLIELENGAPLPMGLRVDAFIVGDPAQVATAR